MTAAELQAVAAAAKAETLILESATEQAILRGLVAAADTFGLTHGQERLTTKLRGMAPALRETILTPKAEQT